MANLWHPYFFESLRPFSHHLLLGNHDELSDVSRCYDPPERRPELYYSLEDEKHTYLFLDSSSSKIGERQLSWLESNLKTKNYSSYSSTIRMDQDVPFGDLIEILHNLISKP